MAQANTVVHTADAPTPVGPYSQAIHSGNDLFCSGQIPLDPATGRLIDGDTAAQAERVMQNIGALLRAAGFDYAHVIKTTIFLIDMNDFAAVNTVYATYFASTKPARSTVAVAALPLGARVEIEVLARKN